MNAIEGDAAKLLARTILGEPLGSLCTKITSEAAIGETFAGYVEGDKLTMHFGPPPQTLRVFTVTSVDEIDRRISP